MGGPISGSSSLIKSLSTVDTQKHLVASGSLMDLPNPMVYPTLHVLISVKACKENATCKTSRLTTDIAREVRGMYYPYKAWIGQIESRNVQMTGNLNPTAVPLDFREVAPNHTFMINGVSSNHCAEIVDLIRKALRMANRADRQRDAVHELVAGPGDLWADASIMLKGETMKVILRAEDSKHLSALKSCLVMLLGNNTKLQIEASYSEILEKILCFLRIFKEEIKQRRSMLKSIAEAALYNTSKDVEDFMTPALVECEMQMRTDRQFCSLLSALRMGSV